MFSSYQTPMRNVMYDTTSSANSVYDPASTTRSYGPHDTPSTPSSYLEHQQQQLYNGETNSMMMVTPMMPRYGGGAGGYGMMLDNSYSPSYPPTSGTNLTSSTMMMNMSSSQQQQQQQNNGMMMMDTTGGMMYNNQSNAVVNTNGSVQLPSYQMSQTSVATIMTMTPQQQQQQQVSECICVHCNIARKQLQEKREREAAIQQQQQVSSPLVMPPALNISDNSLLNNNSYHGMMMEGNGAACAEEDMVDMAAEMVDLYGIQMTTPTVPTTSTTAATTVAPNSNNNTSTSVASSSTPRTNNNNNNNNTNTSSARRPAPGAVGSSGRKKDGVNAPAHFNVSIRCRHKQSDFMSRFPVEAGEYVFVEGDRGEDVGQVISCEKVDPTVAGPRTCGNVLRGAKSSEVQAYHDLEEDEADAVNVCQEMIASLQLNLKVDRAAYQFDRKKLTFFYEADGRVDFRALLRDLFQRFRCRIWMERMDEAGGAVENM
eukprot:PhF_6_TR25265/c3_g1_i2/m.34813